MLLMFLVSLCLLLFSAALFLGNELLHKFDVMRHFVQDSPLLVEYYHPGGSKPLGMRNIVLRGNQQFKVLIGFRLNIPMLKHTGYDYYGWAESDTNGRIVISTYLGRGDCFFQFLTSIDSQIHWIVATSTEEDQALPPTVVYPPHGYQSAGFYG